MIVPNLGMSCSKACDKRLYHFTPTLRGIFHCTAQLNSQPQMVLFTFANGKKKFSRNGAESHFVLHILSRIAHTNQSARKALFTCVAGVLMSHLLEISLSITLLNSPFLSFPPSLPPFFPPLHETCGRKV